jgi:hypothetical protein
MMRRIARRMAGRRAPARASYAVQREQNFVISGELNTGKPHAAGLLRSVSPSSAAAPHDMLQCNYLIARR